ncbi:Saposin B-type domain-containing protein [Caenorhabditis elegans]|uniref:Saposin B-type domain-containing protein n=1 Tax=Caenorhabditis elegans TaxID=6239 RepID=C1P665_CAEEL|nr:Saposin B-type domain-containing protein [Caenorhabditis elegans]CAX65084.1 Saposin B-type domain-containing protein [Caenorhabditis elegans]|eukprot:NP_001256754.1 Uncharacterized protein CELE_Y26G10.7 [Caenorhabditis elegans]
MSPSAFLLLTITIFVSIPIVYSYPSPLFCSLCTNLFEQALVADLEDLPKFLEQTSTELCSNFPLPIDVTRQCTDYLSPFFSNIVQFLKSGSSPESACAHVGIC